MCIMNEKKNKNTNQLESKLKDSLPNMGEKANYEWLMESKAQLERGEVVVANKYFQNLDITHKSY